MLHEFMNRAALYLRLSREDGDTSLSESIRSQKLYLMEYARKHGFHISAIFVDDGISGTRWERPAFQEMLHAVSAGKIDIILVKDLSRLSRDYIRTGELLERWFPEHGVRLIAVSDGVDTGRFLAANDFSPMRAVMDDWYARDISKKVRAAIYARQRNGYCTTASLPYGYRKEDGRIEVDESAAEIVCSIYQMYLEGESCCAIAKTLTSAGAISPNQRETWNDVTVRRILRNPAYRGEMQLHTTEKIGYKSGKRRLCSETEHISYAVPPIVTQHIYMEVSKRMDSNRKKTHPKHWMSGCVFCKECGARMILSENKRFICGGRRRQNGCLNPAMPLLKLEQMLIDVMMNDGCFVIENAMPSLVEEIRVGKETAELFLRYQKP